MKRFVLVPVVLLLALAWLGLGCSPPQTVPPPTTPTPPSQPAAQPAPAAQDPDAVIATAPRAPLTTSKDPWIGAATSSRYVLTDGRDQFLGVWVDVPDGRAAGHVPISLVLTIDTSGSMSGDKIVQARAAARTLVSKLHDGDMVAIHAFSDAARELVAPTVLDQRSRALVTGTIAELNADGATNIQDALERSVTRVSQSPATHPVRRVVMISDGRATAGLTSPSTLGAIAERGSRSGVQVTALGVGLDYDEETLNTLAISSSGRLYHLDDAKEMPGIIESELALLQRTMATRAVVHVVPAPGVEIVGASGVHIVRSNDGSLSVSLGSLFAGQRREILVRYRISGGPAAGEHPVASTRLHFDDPADGGLARVQELAVRAERTADEALAKAHQDPQIQAIIALNEAATVADRAREQLSAGEFDGADAGLAAAETKLRQNADRAKNEHEKQRMMSAAESIAKSRRAVSDAKKAPPAARPAAARAGALRLNDSMMDAYGY